MQDRPSPSVEPRTQASLEFDGSIHTDEVSASADVPAGEEMPAWRRYFESAAEDYDDEPFTKATDTEVALLREVLGLRAGDRVLDVGCGTGRHAVALAGHGCEVTGVDLSPAMLEVANRRAEQAGVSVTLVEADARHLPPLGPFDAAVCLCEGAFCLVADGAEPLGHDQAILTGILAQLRPGGRLVLTGLHGAWLLDQWKRGEAAGEVDLLTLTETSTMALPDGGSVQVREHYHLADGLRTLAAAVGFEVEAIWAGSATNWRREPPTVDDIELMLIARRPGPNRPT